VRVHRSVFHHDGVARWRCTELRVRLQLALDSLPPPLLARKSRCLPDPAGYPTGPAAPQAVEPLNFCGNHSRNYPWRLVGDNNNVQIRVCERCWNVRRKAYLLSLDEDGDPVNAASGS
jgi:hypothetical protein